MPHTGPPGREDQRRCVKNKSRALRARKLYYFVFAFLSAVDRIVTTPLFSVPLRKLGAGTTLAGDQLERRAAAE